MATNRSIVAQPENAAEAQRARLAANGSARHPYLLALSVSLSGNVLGAGDTAGTLMEHSSASAQREPR